MLQVNLAMSTTCDLKHPALRHPDVDARLENTLVDVKFGVDSLRTLRTSLVLVAYPLGENPACVGYLVLVDSSISPERLAEEWRRVASILREDVLARLSICLPSGGGFTGIPREPDAATQRMLAGVVAGEHHQPGNVRTDFSFVLQKLLLLQWLTSGAPVTSDWLARTAGCSYPSVARLLASLGGLVERGSDRRVRLRWFPKEGFARMLAVADRARSTVRFADASGQPRPVEAHLRRLEKLAPPGLALGGVLGARHYDPALDLAGVPRLDLSMHVPGKPLNLEFMERLDPGLRRVDDPLAPANVVVHAVRQADAQFTPRTGGLAWADPVECLFDLHEARLEAQAAQFLENLQHRRPPQP